MKTDAFIRRIDSSGSVILPVDYRRSLQLEEGDQLEISLENKDTIRIRKYQGETCLCGKAASYKLESSYFCRDCLEKANRVANNLKGERIHMTNLLEKIYDGNLCLNDQFECSDNLKEQMGKTKAISDDLQKLLNDDQRELFQEYLTAETADQDDYGKERFIQGASFVIELLLEAKMYLSQE